MKELTCDEALMAKMAELDGEAVLTEEARRHFSACDICQQEALAMQSLEVMFRSHGRVEHTVNLWPQIRERISTRSQTIGWRPFATIAAALVAFKFIEMSLRTDPGFLFGLVPLVFAVTLFAVLRENPFRINVDLLVEK